MYTYILYAFFSTSGIRQDVNIFNILLRVYNYNEFKVVPSEFLEKMKENDVKPNLVSHFCQPLILVCYFLLVEGHVQSPDRCIL